MHPTGESSPRFPQAMVLAAVVMWGISFVATKAALSEIGPVALVTLRFGLGSALLLVLVRVRGGAILPPRDAMPSLALMGFVGVFVHQMLQACGLTLTSAVSTGWLIGLVPVWSALLSAWLGKERFGAAKAIGLGTGLAGALLVMMPDDPGAGFLRAPTTRGDFLILLSTVNWAVYSVLGHTTIRRLGPVRATAGAMTSGWLMVLMVLAATGGWREIPSLSAAGWGAVLFLGIGCSGLGYLFWYGALERVEVSRVAAFLYLEPLVTLTAAVILLGEPVPPTTVAGGLLVMLGVLLVQRARP